MRTNCNVAVCSSWSKSGQTAMLTSNSTVDSLSLSSLVETPSSLKLLMLRILLATFSTFTSQFGQKRWTAFANSVRSFSLQELVTFTLSPTRAFVAVESRSSLLPSSSSSRSFHSSLFFVSRDACVSDSRWLADSPDSISSLVNFPDRMNIGRLDKGGAKTSSSK